MKKKSNKHNYLYPFDFIEAKHSFSNFPSSFFNIPT